MAQHIEVRVLDRYGRPVSNERVSIFPTHVRQTGGMPDQFTDATGLACFELELDVDEEVILYVKGREQVPKSPLRARYQVVT